MKFKLGQAFYMRDARSDYECTVISVKKCQFLGETGFDDYMIKRVRINDFHISFYPKDQRTNYLTLRYLHDEKKLKEWVEPRSWPGESPGHWGDLTDKIFKDKPKDLRKCEHSEASYRRYLKRPDNY